jgi:dihydrofolate reductase
MTEATKRSIVRWIHLMLAIPIAGNSGDLKTLVEEKLASRYQNIWLVGGAMLSQRFLALGLVDEINLTIAPILLGDGLRLFGPSVPEKKWDLKNAVAYKNGFVDLSYSASAV